MRISAILDIIAALCVASRGGTLRIRRHSNVVV
jgi:hypothetical protein